MRVSDPGDRLTAWERPATAEHLLVLVFAVMIVTGVTAILLHPNVARSYYIIETAALIARVLAIIWLVATRGRARHPWTIAALLLMDILLLKAVFATIPIQFARESFILHSVMRLPLVCAVLPVRQTMVVLPVLLAGPSVILGWQAVTLGWDGITMPLMWLVTVTVTGYCIRRLTRQLSVARTEVLHLSARLAHMSHELRTPLNAIIGFNALMAAESETDGHVTVPIDWTRRIESNSKHLLAMINNVLDLAKIEAGKMPLHRQPVSLRDVSAEVSSSLASLAREKDIELVTTVADLHVDADPVHVYQILTNLLSNALKFTPASGRVTVSAQRAGPHNALTVTDTGPGIDPADQRRIFEDFEQSGSSHSSTPGTGLGLALARRLTQAHGGHIELESTPGQGAAFTVFLPTTDPAATNPETAASQIPHHH
ncbi:HAMP domain-containing sensor histidine kinase [Actinoplanes sp. NEAU-A12]|uniref:histidine kinase n=1 Tax=Actinoplanes sandaracinus TaxID=3045177 RepID=A0ABT6WVN4_9ACTN|nr:HAMP domain-containing sensor histidine kinase [Actinoplanes sandaracinus]MDI6103807.1 HAMP domain-containing sensor histidine kinase [Actinoplanes sandaracinus]